MACPNVLSGQSFLTSLIEHVDCQARSIGFYGYGALADPGSPVALALTALLTVFVALFGIRLAFGQPMAGGTLTMEAARLGLVLTLATSWPAWRVVGYDLLIYGPKEVAQAIMGGAQLPGGRADLIARLQAVDNALASFGVFGSGRLGVATGDWFQLGLARNTFLVGTVASISIVKLASGVFLALAPLAAILFLFRLSTPIFIGWMRGMAALFFASITITLALAAELAILEPWMQNALQQRASGNQTLDAPTEAVAITLSFTIICFSLLALCIRLAFWPGSKHSNFRATFDRISVPSDLRANSTYKPSDTMGAEGRAQLLPASIQGTILREERIYGRHHSSIAQNPIPSGKLQPITAQQDRLGSSYRRNVRRGSTLARKRDRQE